MPNKSLISIYHRFPAFMQSWLASGWGLVLRKRRYGKFFVENLGQYEEREFWSLDQWKNFQNQSLQRLLQRAVTSVPYYRDLYRQGKFPIEKVTAVDQLSALPILEKEVVRAQPLAFLAEDCNPRTMIREHTSGTSGTPLQLYWSPATTQSWYACFERRVRNWNGLKLGDRWAMLGGQLITPFERKKPPFWVWNAATAQLYMSVYHLKPEFMDSYLDEMKAKKVKYLFGYASAMATLASHVLETKRKDIQLQIAISNAEPFFDFQRRRVEEAFGCMTRDTYAPSELTVAAFECQKGRLHLSPDLAVVEALKKNDTPAALGELGGIVGTSLLNSDHLFIRYRQGDRGALSAQTSCECGRTMPILDRIEGRADDVLVTLDGRRVGRLDPVFKSSLNIREAQIIQMARDKIEVLVVGTERFGDLDRQTILKELGLRMGSIRIDIRLVDQIERGSAGKFKAVVNRIPELEMNEIA